MGLGIDLGRSEAPELAKVLDDFKDQLLIALVNRLKDKDNEFSMPVDEIDMTGGLVMDFTIDFDNQAFKFKLIKKS